MSTCRACHEKRNAVKRLEHVFMECHLIVQKSLESISNLIEIAIDSEAIRNFMGKDIEVLARHDVLHGERFKLRFHGQSKIEKAQLDFRKQIEDLQNRALSNLRRTRIAVSDDATLKWRVYAEPYSAIKEQGAGATFAKFGSDDGRTSRFMSVDELSGSRWYS